jgi:hypothetical protein
MPSIVAAATDLRLVYPGVPLGGRPMYDIAMLWRRIGSMGEVLSDPVSLDLFPTYYGRNPAQAFGDDTVILMSAAGQEELAVVRLDANGKTVGAAYDLARAPTYGVLMYDMARRGSELSSAGSRSRASR